MARKLDTSKLQQFKPNTAAKRPKDSNTVQQKDKMDDHGWPSREAPQEGQFTIRARLDIIDRFRKICKDDRRTYADMLEILMEKYDQ